MATGSVFNVVECGLMHATAPEKTDGLYAGEVGYITGSIKTLADAKVGDTVTLTSNPAEEPLPGYREAQPMVFCGIYPVDGARYGDLKDALESFSLTMRLFRLIPKHRLLSDSVSVADFGTAPHGNNSGAT